MTHIPRPSMHRIPATEWEIWELAAEVLKQPGLLALSPGALFRLLRVLGPVSVIQD